MHWWCWFVLLLPFVAALKLSPRDGRLSLSIVRIIVCAGEWAYKTFCLSSRLRSYPDVRFVQEACLINTIYEMSCFIVNATAPAATASSDDQIQLWFSGNVIQLSCTQ